MKCIGCEREATAVLKFGIVVSYICEHCEKKFGVSDQGYASAEEIEELQRNQMEQIILTGVYKPLRIRNRYTLRAKGENIRLYSPARERERVGILKASVSI